MRFVKIDVLKKLIFISEKYSAKTGLLAPNVWLTEH